MHQLVQQCIFESLQTSSWDITLQQIKVPLTAITELVFNVLLEHSTNFLLNFGIVIHRQSGTHLHRLVEKLFSSLLPRISERYLLTWPGVAWKVAACVLHLAIFDRTSRCHSDWTDIALDSFQRFIDHNEFLGESSIQLYNCCLNRAMCEQDIPQIIKITKFFLEEPKIPEFVRCFVMDKTFVCTTFYNQDSRLADLLRSKEAVLDRTSKCRQREPLIDRESFVGVLKHLENLSDEQLENEQTWAISDFGEDLLQLAKCGKVDGLNLTFELLPKAVGWCQRMRGILRRQIKMNWTPADLNNEADITLLECRLLDQLGDESAKLHCIMKCQAVEDFVSENAPNNSAPQVEHLWHKARVLCMEAGEVACRIGWHEKEFFFFFSVLKNEASDGWVNLWLVGGDNFPNKRLSPLAFQVLPRLLKHFTCQGDLVASHHILCSFIERFFTFFSSPSVDWHPKKSCFPYVEPWMVIQSMGGLLESLAKISVLLGLGGETWSFLDDLSRRVSGHFGAEIREYSTQIVTVMQSLNETPLPTLGHLLTAGHKALMSGSYLQAIAVYTRWVFVFRRSEQMMKKSTRALLHFVHLQVYEMLGKLFLTEDRFLAEAEAIFLQLVSVQKHESSLYVAYYRYWLAVVFRRQGDLENAWTNVLASLRLQRSVFEQCETALTSFTEKEAIVIARARGDELSLQKLGLNGD